jgi:PAS domain-containing protein
VPPDELERRYAISCEDAIEFVADSSTGFAIVERDFTFRWCNAAYCKMLSLPLERIVGHKFSEFTHPDDVEIDERLATEVAEGKRRGYILTKRYLRWGNVNGKDIQREVYGDLHVQGAHDSDGKFYYRVQFRAYLDLSNQPKSVVIPWRQMVQWACENWKLSAAVAVILIVSIFGSTENLVTLLRELTGNGVEHGPTTPTDTP